MKNQHGNDKGNPENVDFGVLAKYRRNGIGSKLMDIAEQIASTYSDVVYLGAGLHSGYGSAQRTYVIFIKKNQGKKYTKY